LESRVQSGTLPSDLESESSTSSLTQFSLSSQTLTLDANFVDLNVYGVEEVGEEISVQLRRLMETRLAEYALSLLSELLSRNPQFQLAPSDLDFIRSGVGQKDMYTKAMLRLPHEVIRDPYLFLLYMRQNIARAQFINHLHLQGSQSQVSRWGQGGQAKATGAQLLSPVPRRSSPLRTGQSTAILSQAACTRASLTLADACWCDRP
jgi:hypothetical protein